MHMAEYLILPETIQILLLMADGLQMCLTEVADNIRAGFKLICINVVTSKNHDQDWAQS